MTDYTKSTHATDAHMTPAEKAAVHQAQTGVLWEREPSYFAQKLAETLTQYGEWALPMAQVYEQYAQNKDREWFNREVRKLKEMVNA